jgi:hypothetical protein
MSEGQRIILSLNEAGHVVDKQENVLPLQITGFQIKAPLASDPTDLSQSDQTAEVALKLIKLYGRRMFCNEEDLGELFSIELQPTDEPDEGGLVTVQFPVS